MDGTQISESSPFDPVWRGTKDITERADSGKLTHNAQGWRCVRTYDGPEAALRNNSPTIGSKMSDMGEMQVETVEIVSLGGGVGMMTVNMALDSGGAPDSQPEPVYELDWLEVQKDITRHPRYQKGGDDELTDEEFACLKKARAGDQDAIDKINSNYFNDPSLQSIWSKILSGEEDYVDYIPVITETKTYRSRPKDAVAGCGFIDTPPSGATIPPDYKWLLTSAPVTRQGLKWTMKRVWTGAYYIDPEIYAA